MSDKHNTDQELLSFISEARRFLKFVSSPEWAASAENTDAEHIADLTMTLALSRESKSLPEKTVMHQVRCSETGLVLAIAGNTPAAAARARFLTGMIAAMPRLFEGIEAFMVRDVFMQDRVRELLESNNDKLNENRAQRAVIRQLQAQVDHLLKTIPAEPETINVEKAS
ncbi:hypothetical protein [Bradyrhizobium ottawaense]|uniref:Uncharacterized protein n=1 Tax=Bradyrhizobium ottawaense TaxID=931866 RepID=A0ABY0P559_9BRAD|nr:hypothetical protein [Bradyrhizobium ottawaense]SDH37957.1 hypothetical protein SAMN05444163_0014 [Bradyrhizobium ottawaense]SDK46267.1 hypothetical protein SAMN05444163_8173 [Bradyrhizobium ottawaense]